MFCVMRQVFSGLHRAPKSENILVCKPAENSLLLHFSSAAAAAALKAQAYKDNTQPPIVPLPMAAAVKEDGAELCQLLGILLYPCGVKPVSSRWNNLKTLIHCCCVASVHREPATDNIQEQQWM